MYVFICMHNNLFINLVNIKYMLKYICISDIYQRS